MEQPRNPPKIATVVSRLQRHVEALSAKRCRPRDYEMARHKSKRKIGGAVVTVYVPHWSFK
jgi:hypothetical protein